MLDTLKLYIESGIDECIENKVLAKKEVRVNSLTEPLLLKDVLTLEQLKDKVERFEDCEIKKAATNTVFGNGSPKAEIMFIGEAPGANEDKDGIPFCGQSGKLLNNIIKALGFNREDVYITNTVFWRPPGNRRPTPTEIAQCKPFVEKHIALIKPKIIILVGSTAVESLLESKVSMHELREDFYDYTNPYLENTIKTAVIFHPSYLLRQQTKKKLMWYDILRIKATLTT